MNLGLNLGMGARTRPRVKKSGLDDVIFQPERNLLIEKKGIWLKSIEELYELIRKSPRILYQISPRKFEEFIASIFKNQGFYVELTPESRDGGFDILVVQKDSITGDKKFLVECKRYAAENKVGVGIIRSLLGVVVDQNASMGILATTSYFTSGAIQLESRNKSYLSLNDYWNLLKWLDSKSILEKP